MTQVRIHVGITDLPLVVAVLARAGVNVDFQIGHPEAQEADLREDGASPTGAPVTCSRCHGPADGTHRRCQKCRAYERDRQRTRRADTASSTPSGTSACPASSSSSSMADSRQHQAVTDDGDDGGTHGDAERTPVPSAWSRMRAAAARRATEVAL